MHLSSLSTDLQNTELFVFSISWWILIESDALNEQEVIQNSQISTFFFFQSSSSLLVVNTLKHYIISYIEVLFHFLIEPSSSELFQSRF